MSRFARHRTVGRTLTFAQNTSFAPSRSRHFAVSKHNIVVLDQCFTPYPPFNFKYTIEYHSSTKPDQLPSRIKDSTIIIASDTRVTREGLLAAKNLQLVVTNGTGTDRIDKATLRELGIALCNVPAQSTESVAEHALALYYGLRRKLLEMHQVTMEGKAWAMTGDVQSRLYYLRRTPRTNAEETMVVIGYGALGICRPAFLNLSVC
jgi:glycerate dehydrogenase